MSIEELKEQAAELKSLVSLQRLVAVKFCESEDEIPDRARRPVANIGFHMALCQGYHQARTTGTTTAFAIEDNFCIPGAAAFGLTEFEFKLAPWHAPDDETAAPIDAELARRMTLLPKNKYKFIVFQPFDRLTMEPDVVMIYGTPGQIGRVAKGLTWHGINTTADYIGAAGCTAVVIAFAENRPILQVAAGGEKLFAGTNDYEMAINFPAALLPLAVSGFKKTNMMLPYPSVTTTLMQEPFVPAGYDITYKTHNID
jgi:uncharacterized protein (DUF169 family)